MDFHLDALDALRLADPEQKVAATHAAAARARSMPLMVFGGGASGDAHAVFTDGPASVDIDDGSPPVDGRSVEGPSGASIRRFDDEAGVPGRPDRPERVATTAVPARSPFTTEGRAALVHSICHIEFNAINLALDAVWRFDGMPDAYYRDWMGVADEEAQHFTLLHAHLQDMGWRYGDFAGHDGLWAMCEKTKGDVLARMALVPRTLEARGLDATPLIQAKLRRVNTPDALRACTILDRILHDEVGHVAIGNRWYRWLCERDGFDPVAHYRVLYRRHEAPRLRPPFNLEARSRAGFSAEELDALQAGEA